MLYFYFYSDSELWQSFGLFGFDVLNTLVLLNLMLILTTLGLENAKSFLSLCANMAFFSRLVNLLASRVVVAPVVAPVVVPVVTLVLAFRLVSRVVVAPVLD
jgi:hypothetical protein